MVSIALDNTFFIQIGLFIVLIFILNILLYKPILKIMEERGKKLSGLDSEAKSIDSDVEMRLANYETKIDRARDKGQAQRAVTKKEGLDREVEISAAAQSDALQTLSEAKDKIAKEKKKALTALKKLNKEIAQSIAEKALGRSL